jgi:hypothetical protein
MKQIDQQALTLVEMIKSQHAQLSSDIGPIGNIITLFMHDLVVHFSGILMQRASQGQYKDEVTFPCVDKNYARSPYRQSPVKVDVYRSTGGLKQTVRRFGLSGVAIGEAIPFGYKKHPLIAKTINLFGAYKSDVRTYLSSHKEQVALLNELITEICKTYEIREIDNVWGNWESYIAKHSEGEQKSIRERALIIGTRNNLQNRKLAINYLQQEKEVVAITHGEVSNAVMDEPPFGYSERTLCSTLIDYGEFDCDGVYNSPLITPQRRFFRSSSVAKTLHKPSDNIVLPDRDKCRALYIPTTYCGNNLYGPFHAYEDLEYRRWQKALFNKVSKLELVFKAHPKSRAAPLENVPVEKKQLEDCIYDYDLLVFDYFATGSMLALISDRPVIYCDIGLRRLHEKFARDLNNRCEYVKIDLATPLVEQIEEAFSLLWLSRRPRSNRALGRYWSSVNDRFSWSDLFWNLSAGKIPDQ